MVRSGLVLREEHSPSVKSGLDLKEKHRLADCTCRDGRTQADGGIWSYTEGGTQADSQI